MADWLDALGIGSNLLGAWMNSNSVDDAAELNYQAQQDKLALQKKMMETPTYDQYGGKTGYLPDPVTGEMAFRMELTPEQQQIADALLRTGQTQSRIGETDAAAREALLPKALKGLDVPLADAQGVVDRDIQRRMDFSVNPLLKQIQSQIQRSGGDMYSNTPDRYATAFNEKVLPAMNFGRETDALNLQDTMKQRAKADVNYLKSGEIPSYTQLSPTTSSQASNMAASMTTPTATPSTSGLIPGLLGSNLQALASTNRAEEQSNRTFDSFNRWLGNSGK